MQHKERDSIKDCWDRLVWGSMMLHCFSIRLRTRSMGMLVNRDSASKEARMWLGGIVMDRSWCFRSKEFFTL